jgi:hypothetical protein
MKDWQPAPDLTIVLSINLCAAQDQWKVNCGSIQKEENRFFKPDPTTGGR